MRKRIGIYRATEEVRQLIPSLLENPDIEIAAIVDPDAESIRQQFSTIDPGVARVLGERLTADLDPLLLDTDLHAVVQLSWRFRHEPPDTRRAGDPDRHAAYRAPSLVLQPHLAEQQVRSVDSASRDRGVLQPHRWR
jgi:hypothetical protein